MFLIPQNLVFCLLFFSHFTCAPGIYLQPVERAMFKKLSTLAQGKGERRKKKQR